MFQFPYTSSCMSMCIPAVCCGELRWVAVCCSVLMGVRVCLEGSPLQIKSCEYVYPLNLWEYVSRPLHVRLCEYGYPLTPQSPMSIYKFRHENMFRVPCKSSWESMCMLERWGAGVETQKNVRGEIGGWGRVPFNEPYAPSLSTIYDGA